MSGWWSVLGDLCGQTHAGRAPIEHELVGLHSARRDDYRAIYEIIEDEKVVLIHRVQHRRDMYRPR